jgi:hypothetical protein
VDPYLTPKPHHATGHLQCEACGVRLQDAGVPVTIRTMQGHIHGSQGLSDWPPAEAWREEANSVLAEVNRGELAVRPALIVES